MLLLWPSPSFRALGEELEAPLRIFLTSSSHILVDYKRYQESDPLCCPSAMNQVSFKIEPREAKPFLIPDKIMKESS